MKSQNAVKKVQRAYPEAEFQIHNGRFSTIINGKILSFIENGEYDSINCIHVKGVNEEDDVYTDYFPGSFFSNISQAIRYLGYR